MPDPPKFTFGGPAASSGSSAPSLFGSAGGNTQSGGLFGQSTGNAPASPFGNTPAPSGGDNKTSLFGGSSTPSGGGFSFGGAPSGGSNLFGGATSSTPSTTGGSGFSFGQKPAQSSETQNNVSSTPSSAMAPPSSQGIFGGGTPSQQPASGAPLFSFNNNNNTSSQPGNSGSTTPSANKAAPSLFSTTPAGPPPAAGPGLFGGAKPAGGGANLFGAPKSDNASTAPSTGGLFGAKPAADQPAGSAQSGSSLFGAAPNASQPASNLFGNVNKPAAPSSDASTSNQQPKPSFSLPNSTGNKPLFGEVNSSKPADGTQAPKPAFSLGQPAAPADQSATATSQAPQTSAPSLFGGLNKASPSAATATTGANNSLFGGLGQKKDESAKSTAEPSAAPAGSSLFGGLGKKDEAPKPASSGAAPPSLFGGAAKKPDAANASAAGTTPSLFGAKPTTESATSAPAMSSTTAPAGGLAATSEAPPALGASTTGPAPSAASRLATKSLDEILTLWTTSLTQHQKKFGDMATKVSTWDRQLVENSDKISKLYARTFQAERDSSEVERQLSQVESEQKELEKYLDNYEKQVDEMISRSGGSDGGIDAERDRTYRTAERCSSRLTSMAHDLTTMIEEINTASTNLRQSNKSANTQDPLSQIVRVLNGHLAQLQQIDSGASQLQQKVTTAQREVRSLGRNGGFGNDEVDSFARSYLGRR